MDKVGSKFKAGVAGASDSNKALSVAKDGRAVETPSLAGGRRHVKNVAPTVKSQLQGIGEVENEPDFLRDETIATPARGRMNTKVTAKSKESNHGEKESQSKGSKLGYKNKNADQTQKSSTKNSVPASEVRGGKTTKKSSNMHDFVHRTGEDMHNSLYAKLKSYQLFQIKDNTQVSAPRDLTESTEIQYKKIYNSGKGADGDKGDNSQA